MLLGQWGYTDFPMARPVELALTQGPCEDEDRTFMYEPRVRTLSSHILKWGTDQNYQTIKAASCWIRHDARTLLQTKDQALGSVAPDGKLSWSPGHPADDPFVEALVFTNRAARLMHLSGIVLSITESVEDHFWYSGGMPMSCAQIVYVAKLVADVLSNGSDHGRSTQSRVRLFWNFDGAEELADHRTGCKAANADLWKEAIFEARGNAVVADNVPRDSLRNVFPGVVEISGPGLARSNEEVTRDMRD